MAVDPPRRIEADHLGPEGRILVDQILGDEPGTEDLAPVVDVEKEGIEGLGPLADAPVQALPLQAAEDPGEQVEGDEPLRVTALAIDREGDADAPEDGLGLLQATVQPRDARLVDPALHIRVAAADGTFLIVHLEEGHGTPSE